MKLDYRILFMINYSARVYCLYTLIFFTGISSASADTLVNEKYGPSYDISDYYKAIMDGGLQRALEVAEEHLRQVLASHINDPEKRDEIIRDLAEKAFDKISSILNDSSKNDQEKTEAVSDLIANSMLGYSTAPTGDLGVSYRYSTDYMTAEVSWDRKLDHLYCNEWLVETKCKIDSNGLRSCETTGHYERVNYTVEPDYHIYRVVNGVNDHITTVKGRYFKGQVLFSTDPSDWFKQLKNYMERSANPYAGIGRTVIMDYDSDIREPATTLSYKIVADSSNIWNTRTGDKYFCEDASTWSSQAPFDENGDGYADFVPAIEYSSNNYLKIFPVINSLILN